MIGELDRVVFANRSFVLNRENTIQILMLYRHESGSRLGRRDSELAIEFGNVSFA